MATRLDRWAAFCKENIDKIDMPTDQNYPLNYSKGKEWANSQCDSESRTFADAIIDATRYVSYGEFKKKMKMICNSYLSSYKKDTTTEFVMIIPFTVGKSNTWASIMAFDILKSIITDVRYDVTEVYNDIADKTSALFGRKVRCIICDDCAYTGHQLSYVASIDFTRLEFEGKIPPPSATDKKWLSWYDDTVRSSRDIIKKIQINTFSVDIIVPFIGSIAHEVLSNIHYVKIPKDCDVFPSFNHLMDIKKFPVDILNEFKLTFQYHENISAIYFDHKIADAVSVFHKIYLLAPLFNCNMKNQRVGFVENCNAEKIPDSIDIYKQYIDVESISKDICPRTHYKHINYAFNKKNVDISARVRDIMGE